MPSCLEGFILIKKLRLPKLEKLKKETKKKMKKELIKWIDKRIQLSKDCLKENGTTWDEVLHNEDTEDYGEESENNNFEAGIISGLIELKATLEKIESEKELLKMKRYEVTYKPVEVVTQITAESLIEALRIAQGRTMEINCSLAKDCTIEIKRFEK